MYLIKVFIFLFALTYSGSEVFANQTRNLTILAEQSMIFSLTKIARLYSQKNNIATTINFGSSAQLASNIEEGEPADVFISAHHAIIDSLKQKGLIDFYNNSNIAFDRLAIATSIDNPNLKDFNQSLDFNNALKFLDKNKSIIVIDNSGNSSGVLIDEIIKNLNFNDLQIIVKINEDRDSMTNLIRKNKEQYGVMLLSQAFNKKTLKIIAISDFEINYQALAITGENMQVAREFLKFLKSDIAKKIFMDNGFIFK